MWRLLVIALLVGCAEGPPGPAGPPGPVGPPGPAADRGFDVGAVDATVADAGEIDEAVPDVRVVDAALDATGLPDAAREPDAAPDIDAAIEPDAAVPAPCPPLTVPGLGGPADNVVDEATAAAWIAYRDARHAERFAAELDPAAVAARYRIEQVDIDRGCYDPAALVDLGRGLFERRFTLAEGYGNGLAGVPGTDAGDRPAPNLRRLQKGHFGGPDAARCTDCHWKGGFAGAGDRVDNSFLYGDGDDITTHDPRNPPALWGAGWTERIAAEMTAELAAQVEDGRQRAIESGNAVRVPLSSKGTSFGAVRVAPDGTVDSVAVEGIDPDLVVRPFGWKGVFATLSEFVAHSLHIHFNLQAEALVAAPGELNLGEGDDPDDPDGDGVTREITDGQLTALVLFLATLDAPVLEVPTEGGWADPLQPEFPIIVDAPEFALRWADGLQVFNRLGCAGCHTPFMPVSDPVYRARSATTGGEVAVDLSALGAAPRPPFDGEAGAWLVPVFSDLKRHDMGPSLAAQHPEGGAAPAEWMTRRLWGMGQTGPFLHDGSAATVDEAIARHGGEAQFAVDGWRAAPVPDRLALKVFLASLRRAPAIRIR